jgi:protein gp37
MGEHSGIEWTDHTFNPWWGCVRVSPACEHCYAEIFSKRLGKQIWGVQSDRRFFGDDHWRDPTTWNRKAADKGERHRVFCGSMCDIFETRRDLDVHRERLWKLVKATPNLDWLLLTKRPQNIAPMASWRAEWASNVWLGTTVEDQKRADQRLPHLVQHPAVVRFLSMEPLLGPVDLRSYLAEIDWVILGGESGPGARPMQVEWARSVRDQCVEFGVPLFFKQWGNHAQVGGGEQLVRLRNKGERSFDGRTWDELPIPRTNRLRRSTSAPTADDEERQVTMA